MILKILLVLAVISLIYFIFIKKKPLSYKKDDKSQSNDLVQCESCGTYTELSESILSGNKYYCSNECVGKA